MDEWPNSRAVISDQTHNPKELDEGAKSVEFFICQVDTKQKIMKYWNQTPDMVLMVDQTSSLISCSLLFSSAEFGTRIKLWSTRVKFC